MEKRCSSCGATKCTSEFYRMRNRRGEYVPRTLCKECSKAAVREHNAKHSERRAAEAREYHRLNPHVNRRSQLKRLYGITLETYDEMLAEQSGACAICGGTCATGRALAVDHNHTTGAVRALLCGACNKALGLLRDSPSLLRAAADYLDKHNGTPASSDH